MILDDIFEAMKPSDIPTVMRKNRLTMRDIEKERPQGAYRFRVGDNEFMDLDAAKEFARGTGETVKPIGQSTLTRAPAGFRVIDPRDNRPAATFDTKTAADSYAAKVNGRVETIREAVKKKLADKSADVSESSKPLDITEKKKPVPTNKPLWGRAKAAARSKFDVYPSATAVSWAAKWYRSHGGEFSMPQDKLDEKQDACYHKVRSRYKVWPSAYASGALVQCRKKGAANWGTGGKKK